MSKFSKKLVSGALTITTSVWLSGALMLVPVAHGQSITDLQAQISNLLAQMTLLQAQLNAAQGGAPASAYNFTRDLTVASTGDDVKALQKFLNSQGFPVSASGAGSPGSESTYFGSKTQAALGKYQAAKGISPAAGYFGPKTRAYVTSVVVTPGGPIIVVPGSGLMVSAALDNPASASLPKGATGVAFLKFNISGSGTVDSLVFKRTGIGATGDFASGGVYLYEGGTRLTNGKTINSTSHEVSFAGLNLAVNGTRTLTLVADVAGGATAANRNGFTFVSGTGTPTLAGTVIGSEMGIGGQSVGGIVADNIGSIGNPSIGEQGAKLLELQLTASSTEDVMVYRISLTEGGSISNSQLTNFVLKQSGNTVATAATIGAKDLATLNFTTPFLLEKGQNRIFELFGDVSGSTRSDDTIEFYFDSKADVYAVGKTYGYPVLPTIDAIDTFGESIRLTVKGGDITITFNGPIKGDIALRAQDVTVFDFTIASRNNIEIRNLRLNASTTGLITDEGFNDFKLWDVASNSVISSATDVTTSTNVTVTDVINLAAGASKRMKITVDVDADVDSGDDIQVALLPFNATDIRNLDNNTNVATSTIVPSSQLTGNVQDTAAPALDVQLSGSPASQSLVKGSTNTSLVGISLRASNDNVKITSIKVSASTSSGTQAGLNADVLNVALYDGTTRVSDVKSLTGSSLPSTITFSNMNLAIAKGATKVLNVKGDLSTAAVETAVYFIYLAATTDITAIDSQSNTITLTGTTANSGNTVAVTVLSSGDITVVKAVDDNESKPRLVIAGQEEVLGKFKFTSANEPMTVNKLQILVASSSSATATTTETSDEVSVVKLYDATTGQQIGASGGYSVIGSGANAGIAIVEGLGWNLGKNEERTLIVKAPLGAIDINSANGADSGTSLYVAVQSTGFEAAGSTALDTTITAATSSQKVVYRGRPTVTWRSLPSGSLTTNPVAARVRVAAGATPISFKTLSLKVEPTGATVSAATTSNVTVYDITQAPSTALTLATVVSGSQTASTGSTAIVGGATGYVTVYFTTAEEIAPNSYSDYDVLLTLANISGTVGAAKLNTKLSVAETSIPTVGTLDSVNGSADTGNPSFIWSDNSKISHTESTSDWTTGFHTEFPVSTPWELSN